MKISLVSILILSVLAAGCTSTGRSTRVDPVSIASYDLSQSGCLMSDIEDDWELTINLDCFQFAIGEENGNPILVNAYYASIDNSVIRNRFQEVLISRADMVCEAEKGGIYANRAILDSSLDLASTTLSAASTIVTGDLAKSILSGGAGLSTSTRNNLNANIYQNQIVPAITRVMDAERSRLQVILDAKKSLDSESYSTEEMIKLVNRYHQACSFQFGVQLLLEAALNKEGVDAILLGMNLSTTEQQIIQQMEGVKRRQNNGLISQELADETLAQLEARLREILLLQSTNSQNRDTPVVPSEPDESQ